MTSRDWTLRGVRSVGGGFSVFIRDGRIADAPASAAPELDLEGYVALPGRINAHDHLEFALFPRLGEGRWPNAKAWAEAVYHPEQPPVCDHLRVPKPDRLLWGGLRNLLGGVTTVCHHNAFDPQVFDQSFPVRVLRRFGWAHSPAFEPDLASRRRATPLGAPFILHLGEGTDDSSRLEILELDAAGLLDAQTVAVHGVAFDREGLELLSRRAGSLVWCPSSNLFSLGETLDFGSLPDGLPVALGTDSPLTAAGDFFDELAIASRLGGGPSAGVLAEMTSAVAARVLRIEDGRETGAIGAPADLIIIRDTGAGLDEILLDAPELHAVFVGGRLRLSSWDLAIPLRGPLEYNGRRFFVDADVVPLFERAAVALGDDIRLSGKPVRPC